MSIVPPRDHISTLDRQWQLLSKLTVTKRIGAFELQTLLAREGTHISLRTIQRDLVQLAKRFPIEGDDKNPRGWRWKKGAQVHSFPIMNSSQAVTFAMVEAHLQHLLPPSLLSEIRPWFDLARRSMSQDESIVKDWINRVATAPENQPLIPPAVPSHIQQQIYEALLLDKQIQVHYHKLGEAEAKSYLLSPLGIVSRGPLIYIICRDEADTKIKTFVLHRFDTIEMVSQPAIRPNDFNLQHYIASGALGFHLYGADGQLTSVCLTLAQSAGLHLLESPLTHDQKITIDQITGYMTIDATIPLTTQLIWWLRSFGRALIHIEPPHLAALVLENNTVS